MSLCPRLLAPSAESVLTRLEMIMAPEFASRTSPTSCSGIPGVVLFVAVAGPPISAGWWLRPAGIPGHASARAPRLYRSRLPCGVCGTGAWGRVAGQPAPGVAKSWPWSADVPKAGGTVTDRGEFACAFVGVPPKRWHSFLRRPFPEGVHQPSIQAMIQGFPGSPGREPHGSRGPGRLREKADQAPAARYDSASFPTPRATLFPETAASSIRRASSNWSSARGFRPVESGGFEPRFQGMPVGAIAGGWSGPGRRA